MNRVFHIRPVTRRRLAWLVALLLLWQQVAVAAYACQLASPATGQVAEVMSTTATAAMGDDCAEMRGAPTSPVCRQHCAPGHATQVDARPTSVPLSALTAVPPMLISVANVALQSDRSLARLDQRRTPPLIPRLLFCSLLI